MKVHVNRQNGSVFLFCYITTGMDLRLSFKISTANAEERGKDAEL
jgi:hypothetical protein